MKSNVDLLGPCDTFLQSIFFQLESNKIEVSNFELDHICYRVETTLKYEWLKKCLLEVGDLLTECIIGDRRIATFWLKEPIIFRARGISILELPAPKQGSFYPEGFEHVEFVINCPFEEFMDNHPHIEFNIKGLVKATNKDIRLDLGAYSVKFHNLKYVIEHLD